MYGVQVERNILLMKHNRKPIMHFTESPKEIGKDKIYKFKMKLQAPDRKSSLKHLSFYVSCSLLLILLLHSTVTPSTIG